MPTSSDSSGGSPASVASAVVLLIDDSRSQAARIEGCLASYRIAVEWRASYRGAVELLRDPEAGLLIDLILIDQAFEAAADDELLTHSEVDALAGAEEWDVQLHQGLFILTRLSQDMREGRIAATPMMILTHYARVEIAAQVGLADYESKRRLLSDPFGALQGHLPQMRPTPEDVDRRLRRLFPEGGALELAAQVRSKVLDGLILDEVCRALERLREPDDWVAVGRTLRQLDDERSAYPVERLASTLAAAWLASPAGWLRIRKVETLGPLGHGFEAFRAEIRGDGPPFAALFAVAAELVVDGGAVTDVREGLRLMREIDPRCRPVRLRDRSWVILGCWLREPEPEAGGLPNLLRVTSHVESLHRRGLAHGLLTPLTASFEQPVFGGVRCLTGERDLAAMRGDDRHRLTGLIAGPDLSQQPPPICVDHQHSGTAIGFHDLLVASLGSRDGLLCDVTGEGLGSPPLDFVVCTGGVLTVLEHRARVHGAGQPDSQPFAGPLARCQRSAEILARQVERGLGLPRGTLGRRVAIVVNDAAEVCPPAAEEWRTVMTEPEAIAALTRLSRTSAEPRGADMLAFLPRRGQVGEPEGGTRALHWTRVPHGARTGVTMRTWSKRWPPESWRSLKDDLVAAGNRLRPLPFDERPLPFRALRLFDIDGRALAPDVDAARIERVEYDIQVPTVATPLPTCSTAAGSEICRRRMAATVLRSFLRWERLHLAYAMEPECLLHDRQSVYCDLLQSVAGPDAELWWRQRSGAAGCLVFLLSPWPFAWPAIIAGSMPVLSAQSDESSAWGIAATAVLALLDPDQDQRGLRAQLVEIARLLEATARLGRRFPSWPAGLTREALSWT